MAVAVLKVLKRVCSAINDCDSVRACLQTAPAVSLSILRVGVASCGAQEVNYSSEQRDDALILGEDISG
jgi:hypothetical protein